MARGDARGLRLALFTDTFAPQVNGVTRTIDRLITAVEARGGSVRVETTADALAHADPRVMRWPSVDFWAYPQLKISAPLRSEVHDDLARWRPTLIHATTPFGIGLAGRSAARALGVPFVSSHHTAYGDYLRHYGLSALETITWPFLRWFHNKGRMTFAPSMHVANELSANGIENVRIWSRGVDRVRFNPRHRSAAMRERMGAGPDDVVVAYVGRLAPEKGIHIAIDAMNRLKATSAGSTLRFALAGDGPDEERCRTTAPDDTWFAGVLAGEELSAFYASADIFVFPSITETFGNVVLEAMSSGVPVVGADVGATLELANERTARLHRANDAESLAEAIVALATDAEERLRLREAGIRVAESRTWDAIWDRLLGDYHEATLPVMQVTRHSEARNRVRIRA